MTRHSGHNMTAGRTARNFARVRHCKRISAIPQTIIMRGDDARRAQRLLQEHDRDRGGEQHAGLAQGRDQRDRRDRHGPDHDPIGGERERAADQARSSSKCAASAIAAGRAAASAKPA